MIDLMRLLLLLAASMLLGASAPAAQPAPWTVAGPQQLTGAAPGFTGRQAHPAAPLLLAPIFAAAPSEPVATLPSLRPAAPATAPGAPQAQVSTSGGCTTGGRPARACAPP